MLTTAIERVAPTVQIQVLRDGDELLPKLKQAMPVPNVVIMDLNMPRMNGLYALELLRAQHDYQQLPVIMLTTSSHEQDRARSEKLGASAFYSKPTEFQDLLTLTAGLINQWGSQMYR
ncbi:hypothetical protein GCM10027578_38440 [Spirosoma luteolum]